MLVYLIGYKGWIGNQFLELFKKNNIDYIYSDFRAESKILQQCIINSKATHVLACIGRTHGMINNNLINNIDYLEDESKLKENLNDNLYAPLSLAMFCDKHDIHFTYLGTGCIYDYYLDKKLEDYDFTEDDEPNFFGSKYSTVKGITNNLMKYTNALHLRIRMPITYKSYERDFITKIINYKNIFSNENSMSVLDEILPISLEMMKNNETGTWNMTNPGTISHKYILELYKKHISPNHTYNLINKEEHNKLLLSKRSNNKLSTEKLESKYKITNIKEIVEDIIKSRG